MKVKTYWSEYDGYKTRRQWAQFGFEPLPDAQGVELWTTNYHTHSAIYFSPEEVREMGKEKGK